MFGKLNAAIRAELVSIENMILGIRRDLDRMTKKMAVDNNNSIGKKPIMYIGPETREEAFKLKRKDPELYEYITEVLRLYFT